MNKKLIPAYVLSAFNVILIAVSVGLSLYTFIVVPIFFIALYFTIKGSVRGWFVWVGSVCFLIYFSAQNVSKVNPICKIFFVYHPLISFIILLTSIISLYITLTSFDIKSITSLLIDRVPRKLTTSLLLLLVLHTLWSVIAKVYRFDFNERMNLGILFYVVLVFGFFLTLKMMLILYVVLRLLRRHYVGYFLSYLILLTVSLTWLGYTLNINPLHLFPGVTGVIEAVIQWQLPQYKLLPYFFSTLFSAVCFFLTLFILVGLRDTKEEIG